MSGNLTDDSGNPFDQNSVEQGPQAFALNFSQIPPRRIGLDDSQAGGGAVLLGRYSYALDRSGLRLLSYDLENPSAAALRDKLALDAFPTTLVPVAGVVLPTSLSLSAGQATATGSGTNTFIAVFTGGATDTKQLSLVPVSNGEFGQPRRGTLTINPAVQIVKSKWDPPFMGYFELGADVTSISLINLTAFHIAVSPQFSGLNLPPAGTAGLDANGNASFCDSGDFLPLPSRRTDEPPGLAFSYAPVNPQERIQDFDFDSQLGLAVATHMPVGSGGQGNLRVVLSATTAQSLSNAVVRFTPGLRPKRVTLFPAVTLQVSNSFEIRDLAVVSLTPDAGGDGSLAIVDLSQPFVPTNRNIIPLPAGEGSAGSIQRRADGLLGLATGSSVLLLDPTKLLLSTPASGSHPAFVGRVDLPAGGVRDFVSDTTGVNVIFSGANRRVVQTAPGFQVVRFNALVSPRTLAEQPAGIIQNFLKSATPVNLAEVTKVDFGTAAPPTPDPDRHYYVLVDAPGGVGEKMPLVLAAVDQRGQPQRDLNRGLVPVIVGDEAVAGALLSVRVTAVVRTIITTIESAGGALVADLSLVQRLQRIISAGSNLDRLKKAISELENIFGKFPKRFAAVRLSNNPDHPLFNRYLAGPFMILGGAPREEEVTALVQQWVDFESGTPNSPLGQDDGFHRAYIRPSTRLWVGLPSLPDNPIPGFDDPVLRPFHSRFRLHPTVDIVGINFPKVDALVDSLAADTVILGPLALTVLDLVPAVGGEVQPTIYPGAHRLVRVNFAERPMVFVPGFAGSSLLVENEEMWLGVSKIFDRGREQLRLQPDGTPAHDSHAIDALRFLAKIPFTDFGIGSIYGTWLNHLKKEMGYIEYDLFTVLPGQSVTPDFLERRRNLDQSPYLDQYPIPNLYVYPYDWRRDNQYSAERLRDYVRIVREMHPDADGIDLVGHSNGGLVSRAYMLLPDQRQLIRRFTSVGTPWLGAPKILAGIKTGDVNEMSLNVMLPIPTMRATLQFAPGAHQLLPTREYFDLGFRPLVEDGFDINTNGLSHESYGFDAYMDALAHGYLRKPLQEMGSNLSEHPAKQNHLGFYSRAISDHRGDTNDVEFHHIFGFGAQPDTIAQVHVVGRLVRNPSTTNLTLELPATSAIESDEESSERSTVINPGDGPVPITTNRFRLNEEVEVRFACGDGTVPIGSLARGFGSPLNLNAPHARLYPLIGAADEITGHNPMLNTDAFLNLFDDVLVERRVKELIVNASVPTLVEGSSGVFNLSASGSDLGGQAVNFVIDFGDGSSDFRFASNAPNATIQHRYRQSGTYLVSVGAVTESGINGFTSRKVTVANAPPLVTIQGGNASVGLGDTRVFIAHVTDPGLEDSHKFRWESGSTVIEAGRQFAMPFTFNQAGARTVKVTVTDSDGATASASASVTVSATASSGPVTSPMPPESGPQPQRNTLSAFPGGQPELIVRISGHRPGLQGTIGISTRDDTITVGSQVTALAGQVFDVLLLPFGGALLQETAANLYNRFFIPAVARFLGQLAQDAEYARLVRRLPPEASLGVDPSQIALIAAGSTNRPIEVDALYLEGGIPKILHRYFVAPASDQGVRLKFNWIELTATLEIVTPGPGGSLLNGNRVQDVPPKFVAAGEQRAGDRQGPVVVGIGNPFSGRIELFGRDNFTPSTNISSYLSWDSNGDGRLDDEIFYEIATNLVDRSRLPSRPFVVVGSDEHSNLGDFIPFAPTFTGDFRFGERPGDTNTYAIRLAGIKRAVRGSIQEAMVSSVADKFLLRLDDIWILEQGSGAGLWKTDPVAACNGLYRPGFSDNDYELYFPVHLAANFGFNPSERSAFILLDPYADDVMTGDWYFARPQPADGLGVPVDISLATKWRYEMPDGFTNHLGDHIVLVNKLADDSDVSVGYASPFTPAEVIARTFVDRAVKDPARRELLPDINFFPERREHFMYGAMHLQRPPAFGDDPIGDGGLGRQLLVLKWVLEGAYVTESDTSSGGSFNQTAPPLASIYDNWRQYGVPLAEGAEWGYFQEYAAAQAKPLLSITTTYGPSGAPQLARGLDDAVSAEQKKKVKKLGKAAIRAALARLVGDPQTAGLVTNISAQNYINRNIRSFEDFILTVIQDSGQSEAIFGEFAKDRDDVTQPPDLRDFLRAKNGDEQYLSAVVFTPGNYERFVTSTFQFIRQFVQSPTLPGYRSYMRQLDLQGRSAEASQRTSNINLVFQGDGTRPGLVDLITNTPNTDLEFFVAAANYGDFDAGLVTLSMEENGTSVTIGDVDVTANEHDVKEPSPVSVSLPANQTSEVAVAATAAGPVAETSGSDNSTRIEAQPIVVGPPQVLDDFRIEVFLNNYSQAFEDNPPRPGENTRTAKHLLTRNDKLLVRVIGKPGLGPLQLSVSTPRQPAGINLQLPEVRANEYELDPAQAIRVTDGVNPPNNSLRVKDVDPMTFSLAAGSAGPGSAAVSRVIMVDRAEFATVGMQFLNTFGGPEPRLTVTNSLGADEGFFSAGDLEAPDNVGSLNGPGGANVMGRFIRDFGLRLTESGQADVMYVLAHGNLSGDLRHHDLTGPNLILRPKDTLLAPDTWKLDPDFLVIQACKTQTLINEETPSLGTGNTNWLAVLTNSNLRAIVGFHTNTVKQMVPHMIAFMGNAISGSVVDTWEQSMSSSIGGVGPFPWAYMTYPDNRPDTFTRLTPPVAKDRVLINSAILSGGNTCELADQDCCNTPPLETLSEGQLLILSKIPTDLDYPTKAPRYVEFEPASVSDLFVRTGKAWSKTATNHLVLKETLPAWTPSTQTMDVAQHLAIAWLGRDFGLGPNDLRQFQSAWIQGQLTGAGQVDVATNGYSFWFEKLWQGIAVWDDYLQTDLRGDQLVRVNGRVHLPVAGKTSSESVTILAPRELLLRHLDTIRTTLGSAKSVLVTDAHLYWMKSNPVERSLAGQNRFQPVWVFKIRSRGGTLDERFEYRVRCDAVSGNWIGLEKGLEP